MDQTTIFFVCFKPYYKRRGQLSTVEPEQLKRGKIFQEIVQSDFRMNSKGGILTIEQHIVFDGMKKFKQKSGRMDIFVQEDSDDFVTIIEIKATDWDRIKGKNIKKNLYRHGNQLFKYIEKYLEIDNKDVCLAVIYPEPPVKEGLKEYIEKHAMKNYSFPVHWYTEIKS